MRAIILSGLFLCACTPAADGPAAGRPAEAPALPSSGALAEDASAGSTGVGRIAGDTAVMLDAISLQGAWSLDRSCASGDSMSLKADGTVAFGEWGEGMWAVNSGGQLVLILREHTPGVDDDGKGERLVLTFTPSATVGDDLKGSFAAVRADMPAREINAKRCP